MNKRPRQQMLDAVAAVGGYAKLPFIIDEAERPGARPRS